MKLKSFLKRQIKSYSHYQVKYEEFLDGDQTVFLPRQYGNVPSRIRLLLTRCPYVVPEERESFRESQYYGHDTILKRFAGLPPTLNCSVEIEHGAVLGTQIPKYVLNRRTQAKNYLVMGDHRENIFREQGLQCHAIGPYIGYVDEDYKASKKLESLRNKYGRILVYFPLQSPQNASSYSVNRDRARIKSEIDKLVDHYHIDSVALGLYFTQLGEASTLKEYFDATFVFSCGHRNNPFFLNVLSCFLRSSVVVCTEGLSTTCAYSLQLDKPTFDVGNTKLVLGIDSPDDTLVGRTKTNSINMTLDKNIGYENHSIDDIRRELDPLFGFSKLRSRPEIQRLLNQGVLKSNALSKL